MKRIIILFIGLFTLTSFVYAKITTDRNTFDDSVTLRATQKIMEWSRVRFYEFAKMTTADGSIDHWFKFTISGRGRHQSIFGDTVDLKIDETIYPIHKINSDNRYADPHPGIGFAVYDFPEELVSKIKDSQSISIRVFISGQDPILYDCPQSFLDEILEIF